MEHISAGKTFHYSSNASGEITLLLNGMAAMIAATTEFPELFVFGVMGTGAEESIVNIWHFSDSRPDATEEDISYMLLYCDRPEIENPGGHIILEDEEGDNPDILVRLGENVSGKLYLAFNCHEKAGCHDGSVAGLRKYLGNDEVDRQIALIVNMIPDFNRATSST